MATLREAQSSIADVNFWLKIQSGDSYSLADIPSIIPLRWNYIKQNWDFIKQNLMTSAVNTSDPDTTRAQIDKFSDFIDTERSSNSNINPFQDFNLYVKYFYIFNLMAINDISISNEESREIDKEVNRVSSFSKNDFLLARANIAGYRDRFADVLGLQDDTYNVSFNRSSIAKQTDASIGDINSLMTLQNSVKVIDFILSNLFAVDLTVDPFSIARANANNPEINIGQYSSGRLVRINYGEDLESLANRYLGDPNKWIDIAIANGLKPPYIDEIGQSIFLTANGKDNQVNVGKVDQNGALNIDKFYINQPIFIRSNSYRSPIQRVIINIKQIPVSGEIILELDGDRDLDKYKILDAASIRVFAPNTINSSFYVLIPSNDPLPDNRTDEVPWFLAKSTESEKNAKIDLAIDSIGDLVLTSNSDIKLSYGLDNAIQAIRLKIVTELGSLRYHPNFGLINMVGQKNLDIENIRQSIVESIDYQISLDSRFDRIESLDINYLVNDDHSDSATGINISLTVRMAGSSQVIPISFTINNL